MMMRNFKKFFFLLFLWLPVTVFPFSNNNATGINEQLSHSSVWTVMQDSRGLMWFGTKDGLNLYNGYTNTVFRNIPGDSSSIGNNFIRSLYEDPESKEIWVGTDEGIYIHEPGTSIFKAFLATTEDGVCITGPVNDIEPGKDGALWIAAYGNGIFRYEPGTGSLNQYSAPEDIISDHIWTVASDVYGNVWASTFKGGYCRYNAERDAFDFFPVSETGDLSETYDTKCFLEDTENNCMWIGTVKYGLVRYDYHTGKMFRYINTPESTFIQGINVILKPGSNGLLLGADNGLFYLNINTRKCERLDMSHYNTPEELRSVFALVVDKEKALWIGTYFDGIHYLRPGFDFFQQYSVPDTEGSVVSNIAPAANGSGVWLGMTKDGGLCRFNPVTGGFDLYSSKIEYTNLRAICDMKGELWLGFYSDGLLRYHPGTGRKRHYQSVGTDTTTLSHQAIYKIFNTSGGNIYIGTLLGLDQYLPDKDHFRRIPQVRDTRVHDILEDHTGLVWVATYEQGLFCYNPVSDSWAQYVHSEEEGSLPVNKLICLHQDNKLRLFIGTEGSGLCTFDYKTHTFHSVVGQRALPGTIINDITSDQQGNLWITMGRAICRIDGQSGEVRIIDEGSFSRGNQYNNNAGLSLPDGTIFFGRTGGFVALRPDLLRLNNLPPEVMITGMWSSEHSLTPDPGGAITLGPGPAHFKADFVALSYVSPQHNRYAYYMEGLEEPWSNSGYSRSAVYNSLPPGKYIFHVKAANSDEVWNETGSSVPVHVLTPLALRHYMIAGYLIILGFLVYLSMELVRKSQKRKMESSMLQYQMEKEKELYDQKISFFTNIIHEIRTPLSLIKAPLENIIHSLPPKDQARENLDIMERNVERLHTLANQLLDFRKIEQNVFVYNFHPADVSEIVRSVSYRFKSICKLKGVRMEVTIPEGEYTCVVDAEAINKIMGNLLNNALKYARDTISVILNRQENDFVIEVSNNGEEIPSEYFDKIFLPFFQINDTGTFRRKEGSGVGLALVKHLVEKHEGRIDVRNENNQVVFTVAIPFVQATLEEESLENDVLEIHSAEPAGEKLSEQSKTDEEFDHTVLVVEDNVELLEFLTLNLGRLYNIVTANNGKEALERLDETRIIDVIVTDILMPVMDGIDFCKAVRSEPMYCHIPIILLTAQTDIRSKTQGLEDGADVFIEKPFSPEFLKAQIASIIKNRNQLKEVFASSPVTPPQTIAKNCADLNFITRVNQIIMDNLSETENLIDSIALHMSVSRSGLHKKIKSISGVTPNDYIQLIRLKKAAELLGTGEYQINEVAYLVGFNTPSYFSKCFFNQFGLLPRDFANKSGNKNNNHENQS
ncbi:MAG TPA: two-component regulator propeller domain-containing protein [Bacteroidales bacterium]|nr:two-component regulator propeller domain-containing protein [Bacteroidales bacterium]